VDALRIEGYVGSNDWGIARTLFRLEGFNGFGYHNFGVNSPYLYGGSTVYGPPEASGGKYVRDGVFDASVVDSQLGTAVILKALMALDPSIDFDVTTAPAESSTEPDDELAKTVVLVQESLNKLGAVNPPLVEDGINGPKTKDAIAQFQSQHGLTASGLPDAATIAALAKATPATPGPIPTPTPGPAPVPAPQPIDLAQLLALLLGLANQKPAPAPIPAPAPVPMPTPAPPGLPALLQQLQSLLPLLQNSGSATQKPAAPADLSQALQQLQNLAQVVQTLGKSNQPSDPISWIERLLPLVQKPTPVSGTTTTTGSAPADQLKQIAALVNAIVSQTGTPALGQVNGALGDTIGNLLNGKKTAVGIGGSLLTTLLAGVTSAPGSGGLAGLLGTVANAVPGLSSFTLPIFLAMTAWGVLGKMEKWSQGTAPPPKPQN
jgi:peptidoglycan hydrolase-like protein with peptidoglycan-binding domain